MTEKPSVNSGIIAKTFSATTVAVGEGATAHTAEGRSRLASEIELLKSLIGFVRLSYPNLPEVAVAERLSEQAASDANDGDRKTLAASVQSIVSIFKSIGDTISTSQKIVEVAERIAVSLL